MRKRFNKVCQFKISLKGIRPPIWRRIQVPETYTFWDLHVAIQDAMGWSGCHLHEFEMPDPSRGWIMRIGIPSEEDDFSQWLILSGRREKIANWFSMENRIANYTYDFGDGWEHKIQLEKILPRDKNVKYPICIAGKRACPPEDCGGVWGYKEFLEAIRDPNHERHKELLEWVGGEFDPEYFDANEVFFEDPDKHWQFVKDWYVL